MTRRPGVGAARRVGFRGVGGGAAAAWTPARLTTLRGWYRADLGVTLVGSDVDAWADQSGIGNNLVAPAAGNRPLYEAAGFGSRPSVLFDGTLEFLRDATFSWGASVGAYTVAIIGESVSSTTGEYLWAYDTSIRAEQTAATKFRHRGPGAVVADSASNNTVAGCWVFTWSGTQQQTYRGSASEVGPTANANAGPADGAAFSLASTTTGGAYCNVRIAEVIVQRARITSDELTALAAYSLARYGV